MRAARHTLGPWAAHEWSGGWIVYGGRQPLAAGIEVARVNANGDENDRHEADARLIAASSELLSSCEALLDDHRRMEPHHEHLCAACIAAQAAIAKAHGGGA